MGTVEILKNTEKRKEEKPLLIFWCMSLKSPPTHVLAGTQTYTYMHTRTLTCIRPHTSGFLSSTFSTQPCNISISCGIKFLSLFHF